ncbi:MAG: hypothetical protein AAGI68_12310 [Planctomycetota bacterium]
MSGFGLMIKVVFTAVLVIGALTTVYGALAFFVLQALPPNGSGSRLPSLYVMFAGMGGMLAGAVGRNLRL